MDLVNAKHLGSYDEERFGGKNGSSLGMWIGKHSLLIDSLELHEEQSRTSL